MVQLNKRDFKDAIAKMAKRKQKRATRRQDNAELDQASGMALNRSEMGQEPMGTSKMGDCLKRHLLGLKRKNAPNRRQRAFERLKRLNKTYVIMRNAKLNGGLCEIAMTCGGHGEANTWYHGWPQKGGNGLRFDHRSHFASCGPCNMGEYGARMRHSFSYENRHKEILGALWYVLNPLHGRRPIGTKEAEEMGDEYERRISCGEWNRQ